MSFLPSLYMGHYRIAAMDDTNLTKLPALQSRVLYPNKAAGRDIKCSLGFSWNIRDNFLIASKYLGKAGRVLDQGARPKRVSREAVTTHVV